MGSDAFFVGIAIMQVITGSLNTIFVKLADEEKSKDSSGEMAWFVHPFLQAASMFVGEMMMMVVYFIYSAITSRKTEEAPVAEGTVKFRNPRHGYLFLIPAMCDMIATSTMYFGLTWTTASSFQIYRGSLIIFTGLLTVMWLRKRLEWFKWVGMFAILGGLAITGVADLKAPKECYSSYVTNVSSVDTLYIGAENFSSTLTTDDANCADSGGNGKAILGNLLIVAAQVVMAFQGVYEEKILVHYDVNPLLAVGWEGFFGFSVLSILLVAFGYWNVGLDSPFHHGPNGYFEDALDGFTQLGNNSMLLTWFICTMISIGFFNFAGMLVTKKMSATQRTVLDAVRTAVVWIFFLIYGTELFTTTSLLIKITGFLVVVTGVFLFNNILFVPLTKKLLKKK